MSAIHIAVGQCGNQVAASYFNVLSKYEKDDISLLGLDDKLRGIFIDSEQKVVDRIERIPALKNKIRKENIVLGRKGRGSNWSYGYYGSSSEAHMVQDALRCIRKELEKCDCYCGAVITHSLAGGTGSGLGSRLTEVLRDEMGLQWILNVPVAPHDRGESPLQHYNILLAMDKLTRVSDSILLLHNDWLLNQLKSPFPCCDAGDSLSPVAGNSSAPPAATTTALQSVDQEAINNLIGQQMANLLSPCRSLYHSRAASLTNMEPWELIRSVCPFPLAKLMRCTSVKRQNSKSVTPVDWPNMVGSLEMTSRRGHQTLRQSLAAVCAARGDKEGSFPARMKAIDARVRKILHPVPWNPYPVDYWIDNSKKEPESLTLAFNSGCIVDYLESVIEKARIKFDTKAYLHWYIRHGSEESDFDEAFVQWDDVINEYNYLIK